MRKLGIDRIFRVGALLGLILSADAWATLECTEGGFSIINPVPTPLELRQQSYQSCVAARTEHGASWSGSIDLYIDLKCRNSCGLKYESGGVVGTYSCLEDRWLAFTSDGFNTLFEPCRPQCGDASSPECTRSDGQFFRRLGDAYARLRGRSSLSEVSENIGKVTRQRDPDVRLSECSVTQPLRRGTDAGYWQSSEVNYLRDSSFLCTDTNRCVYQGILYHLNQCPNLIESNRARGTPVGAETAYDLSFDPALSPLHCQDDHLPANYHLPVMEAQTGAQPLIEALVAQSLASSGSALEADECQETEEDEDSDSEEPPSPAGPATAELVEDEVESTGVRMPGPGETFLATLAADASTRTTGRASYGYLSEKPAGGRFVLTSVLTGPPEKKEEPLTLVPIFHQNRAKGGGARNRNHWAQLNREFVDNSGPNELGLGGLVITRTSVGGSSAAKKGTALDLTHEEDEFLAPRLAHLLGGDRLAWESPEAGSGKSALILLPSRKRLPITLKQFRKTAPPAPPALLEAGMTFELFCTPPATPATFTLDSCEQREKSRSEPIYVPAVARPELTSDHGMIEPSTSAAAAANQIGC